VVLVTGANRGLGLELMEAAIAAGARKVYAAVRDPKQLAALVERSAGRVEPLALDITDERSLAAAEKAPDVSVLFNNADVLASYNVLTATSAQMTHDFATNFFGTLAATKACLPALERAAQAGPAAIVNVLSVESLANVPALAAYSASRSTRRRCVPPYRRQGSSRVGRSTSPPRCSSRLQRGLVPYQL